MAIVASYDWESDSWNHQNGDNPARTAWRDAVAEIAEKAKATLPQCNGRVDSAVKIVLAGDVELQADGTARVASQSNGQTVYHIVNGSCDCKDYPKAPSNWCKHRIAAGIQKRATALAKDKLEGSPAQPTAPAPAEKSTAADKEGRLTLDLDPDVCTELARQPLPEAPASVNCYITLAGRKVQVTLRDSDETRLLARLEALLQRFPAEADSEQEPASDGRWERPGWCSTHGVQMTQHHNAKGSWWSHKTAEGWCHGK